MPPCWSVRVPVRPRWSRPPFSGSRPAGSTPSPPLRAGGGVTTPKAQFGFDIGDDYCLANYRQLAEYWRKLDAESDRLSLVEIGKTAEGRPQLMAIVTSPANQKRLDRYQEIARRLALAEGARPRPRPRRSPPRARRWSGSTAGCTPASRSARSS